MKTLNSIRTALVCLVTSSFIVSCYPEGSISVGRASGGTGATSEPLTGASADDCVARCALESATAARECAADSAGSCEVEAGSVFGVCTEAECAVSAGSRNSLADDYAMDLERSGGHLHGLNVDELVYQDAGLIDVPPGAEVPPAHAALSAPAAGYTHDMNFRERAEACEGRCTNIVMETYLSCVAEARESGSNPTRCRESVGEKVGACVTLLCSPPRHDEPSR